MKRVASIVLLVALLAVAGLVAVLFYNVVQLPAPAPLSATPPAVNVDAAAAAARLAEAVRIPTISHASAKDDDPVQFVLFAELLRARFPLVHRQLKQETVGHSLLYTWTGSDPQARPLLLLAHMDVVPVEPGTEKQWTYPPFAGRIEDGHIWGRGTRDDKGALMAQMEAIEALLASGFQPRHTVVLALGHDEETGGREGAQKMAQLLEERGYLFEFALDEGGVIAEGMFAGVQPPVATVMTGEKGYVSFELSVRAPAGHSSRPPRQTAIGRMARAVSRLQEQPMPARLTPPVAEMLVRLAPYMPLAQRLAIANLWLLEPRVLRRMTESTTTDVLVRTTTAPTLFNAGIKDNVLPSEATAVINFRILPGDSVMAVRDHIMDVVDDEEMEVRVYGTTGDEPSRIADSDSPSFRLLEQVVREQYPEVAVTTGLVIGALDQRHYARVYEQRYSFTPFRTRSEDLAAFHGTNERLEVADYARGIAFYTRLIEQAAR